MKWNSPYLLALVLILSISGEMAFAQVKVKRSVLTTFGATQSNSQVTVCNTFGQPLGVTVVSNGQVVLRQGFQQPKSDFCIRSSFVVIPETDECGTRYHFEYTGDMDPTAVLTWDFGDGSIPASSNDLNPSNIIYNATGNKVIKLLVETADCARSISSIVAITDLSFGADFTLTPINCPGGSDGQISLNLFGGTDPVDYAWSTGEVTPSIENLSAGQYTFTVTDMNECTYSAVVDMETVDSIMLQPTVANETCTDNADGSISLNPTGGSGLYTFLWSDNSIGDDLTNLTAGGYRVTVTDSEGCEVTQSFEIVVQCEKENLINGNVFTPNGDGKNDTWVIPNIELFPNNEVTVYNRWGSPVFSQKSYMNDWFGTNNDGEDLAAGGYYYVIHLNNPENTVISGALTIVR